MDEKVTINRLMKNSSPSENSQTSMMPVYPSDDERLTINFHSPEFNRTDDLNDSYPTCDFESLDGIITADMRHQQERFRREKDDESHSGASVTRPDDSSKIEDIDEPSYVTLISEGRTLIIDSDEQRALQCSDILSEKKLKCSMVIVGQDDFENKIAPANRVDAVSVSGAFCGFMAAVTSKGECQPLNRLFHHEPAVFDLVLDLQAVTSYSGCRLPSGYYAPGSDPAALNEAMKQLPEMRGKFIKPQFVHFQEASCLHGRSRTHNCHKCADICPTGAIRYDRLKMSFNHYLCQGCAACSLVCSTDAIQIVRPGEECWQNKLRRCLEDRIGSDSPKVVIRDTGYVQSNENKPAEGTGWKDVICVDVNRIADVRIDMLLALFASGVNEVLVNYDRSNTPEVVRAVDQQIGLMRALLRGLELPENQVRLVSAGSPDIPCSGELDPCTGAAADLSLLPAEPFSSSGEKRKWIRQAVARLCNRRGIQQEMRLPAGSSFGSISVDIGRCTLCMACAGACPFGALSISPDSPCLKFCEAPCRQCGLCEEVCPEKAIRLTPRLLWDPDVVDTARVLYQLEPFRCVECGLPFASQAMIAGIREKLKGHWMYINERQQRRLSMCSTCRARDALLSEEVTRWKTA